MDRKDAVNPGIPRISYKITVYKLVDLTNKLTIPALLYNIIIRHGIQC